MSGGAPASTENDTECRYGSSAACHTSPMSAYPVLFGWKASLILASASSYCLSIQTRRPVPWNLRRNIPALPDYSASHG
jgi:hypothetical protein